MRASLITTLMIIGCGSEEKITVSNATPSISIFSHSSGDELLDGYVVSFQALVNDDDNSADELSVTWSSNQRTLCEDVVPDAENNVECSVPLQLGESEIVTQVTDANGASGITMIEIEVLPTEAPTIEIISPTSDGSYYSDRIISFSAMMADAEDEASDLSYTWVSSINGELEATAEPTETGLIEEDFSYRKETIITVNVVDQTGKTGSSVTEITVLGPNTLPSCTIGSPAPQTVFAPGERYVCGHGF